MDPFKLITLQHPTGKSAGKIRQCDYQTLCDFVLSKIREVKSISLVGLIDEVEKHFKNENHLSGDFRWMTLAIKLNLEAQGLITTDYPKGRQRSRPLLRLKYSKTRERSTSVKPVDQRMAASRFNTKAIVDFDHTFRQ